MTVNYLHLNEEENFQRCKMYAPLNPGFYYSFVVLLDADELQISYRSLACHSIYCGK